MEPSRDLVTDRSAWKLLWLDCSAGAAAGIVVLILSRWLSQWEGLPETVLLFTGGANLLYAAYSCSLLLRPQRSLRAVQVLVVANFAWVPVCLALVAMHHQSITLLGILHLVGEAMFVGGLALLEWRHRHLLAGDNQLD